MTELGPFSQNKEFYPYPCSIDQLLQKIEEIENEILETNIMTPYQVEKIKDIIGLLESDPLVAEDKIAFLEKELRSLSGKFPPAEGLK